MPQPTNKITQFWNELKRRKVVRVIAMYAATAFIIMEAGEIMLPRLGLPDWTVTFIIVLIIIGFPIAVIFSWIFDITPEGVKKTGSIEAAKENDPPSVPVRRRLRASDLIILALVVVVVILAYPKIFKIDKFEDIRDADGRISIAVLPFKNTTGDSIYHWYSDVISSIIIDVLSESPELSVIDNHSMLNILATGENLQYASMSSSMIKDLASGIQVKSYIWGDFIGAQNRLLIYLRLIDKESNQIITTDSEETHPDSLLNAVRMLSKRIRNNLEIKSYEQYLISEFGEFAKTNSAEAFSHYLKGFRYMYPFFDLDYSGRFELAEHSLKEAITIDPTFTEAYILLSRLYGWSKVNYNLRLRDRESMEYLELATLSKDKITMYDQISINQQRAYLEKKQKELIKANEQLVQLRPNSPQHWQYSTLDYRNDHQFKKAVQSCEKAIELYKKTGLDELVQGFLYNLGYIHHQMGNHEREKEAYEEALNIDASYSVNKIVYHQTVCELSQGNDSKANDLLVKYRSIRETDGIPDYWINFWIGKIHQDAEQIESAMAIYRDLIKKDPDEPRSKRQLGHILIENDINIDEGMELIDHVLEFEPENPDFLYSKGLGYYKQDKTEEALEILTASWDLRLRYDYDHLSLLQEVEQALANQNK